MAPQCGDQWIGLRVSWENPMFSWENQWFPVDFPLTQSNVVTIEIGFT